MTTLWRILRLVLFLVVAFPMTAAAQDLRALARAQTGGSSIADQGEGLEIILALSQSVPYRIETRLEPMRLVIEFREVDWSGFDPAAVLDSLHVTRATTGAARPDWSQIELVLGTPLHLDEAIMLQDDLTGAAVLQATFAPVSPEEFEAAAARSDIEETTPEAQPIPAVRPRQRGDRPLVVALDPGHGGFDPGAEVGGHNEADLMLLFAQELSDALQREAGHRVVLTRETDEFVPLQRRVALAREAGADVFLSLHADALVAGRASGATVYTLSDVASDAASALLAERMDRANLLAGVDLTDQDDTIAEALMDMARLETRPRSERLADFLVTGMSQSLGRMHKRPRLAADFSVLRAPDIPSVLIELGFLSSEVDLENLLSEEWRQQAISGILSGLEGWALADAAEADLVRQ